MSCYIKMGKRFSSEEKRAGKRGVGRPKIKKENKKYTLYMSVNGELAQKVKESFKKTEYKHLTDYLNDMLVPELIKKLN